MEMGEGTLLRFKVCSIILFTILLFGGCYPDKGKLVNETQEEVKVDKKTEADQNEMLVIPEVGFFAHCFFTEGLGWGYDVYRDGKLYLHQPHIPAVSGMHGFVTKEDAQKIADFIMEKIKRNLIPPSVSMEELDSLKIVIPQN